MNRNKFANKTEATPTRVWVGIGELWYSNTMTPHDAIYIQVRDDRDGQEGYLVYLLKDVKKRIDLESQNVRGQRFLGVSANSSSEPPQNRIDDFELSRMQSLLGRFDFVTMGSDNLNKEAIIGSYTNHGPISSLRISFNL